MLDTTAARMMQAMTEPIPPQFKTDKGTGLKLAPRFGLHAIAAPGGTRKGQWFYVGTIPTEVDPGYGAGNKTFFATEAEAIAHAAALGWHCGNPTQ